MNPWLIIIWLATLPVAAAIGWMEHAIHDSADQLEKTLVVVKRNAVSQNAADQLYEKQSAERAAQADSDRVITKEVIRYVQVTPAVDRCTLPGTWRVRHDAAAIGNPAIAAGVAETGAASVGDAAALDTIAENYESCRHYAAQVAGWQEWYEKFGAICKVSP